MAMATSLTQADLSTTQSPLTSSPPPLLTPPLAPSETTITGTAPPYISVTIKQTSLTVTLSGPTIAILSLTLIGAIHSLPPFAVALLIVLSTTLLFIHNDYQNFLALGPGGTPSTPLGYLRINWLKLWALRDPFTPLASDATSTPCSGILSSLPPRRGPRPRVVGIAPQRQIDQFGSRESYLALRRILEYHSEAHASEFGIGTSCFEKHGLGLFARRPVNATCRGEVCHVHNSDHSLHLNLHADDAREVIAKGWGQRHPLTSRCFLFEMPVPRQFTMVYAPRTRDELAVVCRIIEAAGWWVVAKEIRIDLLGEAS